MLTFNANKDFELNVPPQNNERRNTFNDKPKDKDKFKDYSFFEKFGYTEDHFRVGENLINIFKAKFFERNTNFRMLPKEIISIIVVNYLEVENITFPICKFFPSFGKSSAEEKIEEIMKEFLLPKTPLIFEVNKILPKSPSISFDY